jgi:heme-degrading monooxygenase HmoA
MLLKRQYLITNNKMITRTWHGRTSLENADDYLMFLLHEGTKEYLQTRGNLSVKVWQRKEKDCCHFWTVTEWEDTDAIKRFAGDDYEKAKYYPEDEGILLEFEEKVNHYETFAVSA